MTREDEQYYEAYFDLFLQPGWKQITQELSEILQAYRIEDIKDEIDLARVQGERSALFRLVNFESALKEAYESILESESVETL